MNKKRWVVVLLFICVMVFFVAGVTGFILSPVCEDLDQDGKKELLFITRQWGSPYGNHLVILSRQRIKGERIQIYSMPQLNPWKVQVADVDGDGVPEISLGVYKEARLDPVMAKRPFLYNWQGIGISPKWLGSRLARPFEDYIFCNINDSEAEELISVETDRNGGKLIHVYEWKGFGFEGLAESYHVEDISQIQKTKANRIRAKVKIQDKWIWVNISLEKDNVLLNGQ